VTIGNCFPAVWETVFSSDLNTSHCLYIIATTMFMVLSSWHCLSVIARIDWVRFINAARCSVTANLGQKPIYLWCKSTWIYSCYIHTVHQHCLLLRMLLSLKADGQFGVEHWVKMGGLLHKKGKGYPCLLVRCWSWIYCPSARHQAEADATRPQTWGRCVT